MMRKLKKNNYRAVIAGLGDIAWKFDKRVKNMHPLTHAGAYTKNTTVSLVGGCSPECSDREAFGRRYGVPTFSDIAEMVEATNPDIVSICTPAGLHFEQALYCLDKNVPMIWLEKPPSLDLGSMNKLISKSESVGSSKVLVNYQRRYCQSYSKMKDSVAKKKMGRTVFVDLCYSRGLVPNGSHIIDAAFFIFGDKDASLVFVEKKADVDNPSFLLKFAGDITCFVAGLNLPYHCIDISLTFESGRFSIIHGGMRTRCELRREHELFPGFYKLSESATNPLGKGGFGDGMSKALGDLIDSYEKGKQPISNLYTARKTLALIEAVYGNLKGSA